MGSLFNAKWQNCKERPNRSKNNEYMVEKAKCDGMSELVSEGLNEQVSVGVRDGVSL